MANFKNFLRTILPKKLWKLVGERRLYHPNVPKEGILYVGNKPAGFKNLSEKLARQEQGGPFEWPNMVALNQSIQSLVLDAKRVAIIGSGTATFEWHCVQSGDFDNVQFVASEFDADCVEWCKQNRQHANIEYTSLTIPELIAEYGVFDLAVTVDVIEHVDDYGLFLRQVSQLARRAVITTPNRDRNFVSSISPKPDYYQHVREWNSGELYWLLNGFFAQVDLYAMPDVYKVGIEPVGLMSTMTPLIASCNALAGPE